MGNQVNVPQFFKSQYATENLLYRIAYSFIAGDMLTLVLDETGSAVWGWGEKDFRNSPDQKSALVCISKWFFSNVIRPSVFIFPSSFESAVRSTIR